MPTRTQQLDAHARLARSKATLALLLTTALVVLLFFVRRDAATGVLAVALLVALVAVRVRTWARALRGARR